MRATNYTAADILQQLDMCADEFQFPMFDNGYVYLVDSRLSAYRNEKEWALLIEVVGYSYRGGGHDGITNCLHVYGNCLPFGPGTRNENFLYLTADSEEGETFDEEYEQALNPTTNSMQLREQKITIPHDIDYYKSAGVDLENPPKVNIWEFLRGINLGYKEQFLATEKEIRQRIPADLPRVLLLDEWFHPDLASEEKPGNHRTFQMIAQVLETGNPRLYQPTEQPNNHWKNWPLGGTL
ncbi:DUF7003 family protein [Paraflavitalea pollutisoli]|uniref:DUF7003 family protein n=1 Tax=Paraflavitalea pollutisoli TaxID=3034143 RepID=UPI0023EBB225|nr:hypothetical protein [Paraflavitalea sp. H1-2-19X]